MEKGYTDGRMVVVMRVNIFTIESMVMEHIHGQMDINTSVIGRMEKDRVKVNMFWLQELAERGYGIMIKELNG
jgi:hypothetical protein